MYVDDASAPWWSLSPAGMHNACSANGSIRALSCQERKLGSCILLDFPSYVVILTSQCVLVMVIFFFSFNTLDF